MDCAVHSLAEDMTGMQKSPTKPSIISMCPSSYPAALLQYREPFAPETRCVDVSSHQCSERLCNVTFRHDDDNLHITFTCGDQPNQQHVICVMTICFLLGLKGAVTDTQHKSGSVDLHLITVNICAEETVYLLFTHADVPALASAS